MTVDYATVDLTAVASADYEPSLGTLVIPAGALEGLVTVPLIDDPVYEGNETFGLQLTGAAGALIGGETATATILEDDTAPVVSLGDVGVREGDPGRPSIARVLVTLDQSSAQAVTLTYGAVSGTAVAGLDFVVPPWSLTLDPGQTTAAIDVVLREDLAAEGDEAFTVLLYAASGAQIGVGQGTVTVEEDDGPTDFYTLTPCRLLDSRLPAGTIPANRSLTFGAGGRCGIPSEAKAVALNVTAVEPSTPGHFRLGPAGDAPAPDGRPELRRRADPGGGPGDRHPRPERRAHAVLRDDGRGFHARDRGRVRLLQVGFALERRSRDAWMVSGSTRATRAGAGVVWNERPCEHA